jgi:hypothetical protein
MASTPANKTILFSKIDLSDGFWRMIVQKDQRWNFCYGMPDLSGTKLRIVVPSALQMGWKEPPPYLCAATEYGRDLIQWLVDTNAQFLPHPFKQFLLPANLQTTGDGSSMQIEKSLANDAITVDQGDHTIHDEGAYIIKVYVDDYILGVIKDINCTLVGCVARAALFGIHSIFPLPHITGHTGGKDSITEKKLAKGDARFLEDKIILGFLFNGRN